MTRLSFSVFFILLLIGPLVSAQQTLQDLTLSSVITKGHVLPVVVTNDFNHEWLVAWDQSGKVKGRIVKPNGQLSSIKTLVKGKVVDVIHDPIHDTYLILYFHRQSYLRAQLLSGNLKKKGGSHPVQVPSASYYNDRTQLIYDPVAGRFLVFWLESTGCPNPSCQSAIKSGSLDVTGKAISKAVTVLDGGSQVGYSYLRVTRNPENGNLFLAVYQSSKGVASILGYTLKSDGTLLRTRPVKFAAKSDVPTVRTGFSIPDGEFADNGTGIATWAIEDLDGISPTRIKIRQLTDKGTFSSKSKLIAEDDSAGSLEIVFDQGQNAFLILWDSYSRVEGVLLDANNATVLKGPFTIATSPYNGGYEQGSTGAYEKSSGRILIVWTSECFNPFGGLSCPGSVSESAEVSGAIFSSK